MIILLRDVVHFVETASATVSFWLVLNLKHEANEARLLEHILGASA